MCPTLYHPCLHYKWKAFIHIWDKATGTLGQLEGISTLLPDADFFIYQYVIKEALLSSQIEGTQSSLSDLLLHESGESPSMPFDDVREVSNYIAAMRFGLDRLNSGFPLSLRLFREMHGILLRDGRGQHKQPGEFRQSQNWIGGTPSGATPSLSLHLFMRSWTVWESLNCFSMTKPLNCQFLSKQDLPMCSLKPSTLF